MTTLKLTSTSHEWRPLSYTVVFLRFNLLKTTQFSCIFKNKKCFRFYRETNGKMPEKNIQYLEHAAYKEKLPSTHKKHQKWKMQQSRDSSVFYICFQHHLAATFFAKNKTKKRFKKNVKKRATRKREQLQCLQQFRCSPQLNPQQQIQKRKILRTWFKFKTHSNVHVLFYLI